jgi:hypothetical protein
MELQYIYVGDFCNFISFTPDLILCTIHVFSSIEPILSFCDNGLNNSGIVEVETKNIIWEDGWVYVPYAGNLLLFLF